MFLCLVGLPTLAHARSPEALSFPKCDTKLECATHSVVSLLPDWPKDFRRNEEPEGSAIVVANGRLIATADHVLGPAKTARIRTLAGEIMNAKIVIRDPQTDIALLQIPQDLPAFKLAEASSIGSKACAIGNSFGLDISLTCGVVSAKGLSGTGFNRIEDFVQTDASVNPGMSGGALVNGAGELIGMLSAIFTRQSDANIGVNFAVSTQLLTRIVSDFQEDGILTHTKAGLLLRPADTNKTGGITGLEVVRVQSNSPEEKAEIQAGDILLNAGPRRLKRAGSYEAVIALLKKGETIDLQLLRRGKLMIINLQF